VRAARGAAADEAGLRLRGQLAETGGQRGFQVLLRLPRGCGAEELRVVLFLEEHGHEPILEAQLARAEDAAAEGLVLQLALAFEHGVAHTGAAGERVVKRLDEAARGLDEHTVAHGHDGGHADLQQLGGDGLGRLLGLRGLAGFEEDERDAVSAQQRPELAGEDVEVPALVELADVLRVLEAQPAEADTAVIDAVAIEVDHVIRLAGAAGAIEFLTQGGQCGRVEHVDADETAEVFHRFDQRQRARAVIDVAAGVVLRTGGDEQDPDRRGDHRHVEHARVRQAPADTGRLRALEQEILAVVEQFPRQTEQERGGFVRGIHFGLGCARFERGIHVDGETAARMPVDLRPRVHDVCRVGHGQRRCVQELSPFHETRLDLTRAVPKIFARPDGVFLQIPAQFLCLDRPDGRDEPPVLHAGNFTLPRRGRLINEPSASRGAADAPSCS
jgi:hypothetical protein